MGDRVGLILAFILGALLGAYNSDRIKGWVGGAVGRAPTVSIANAGRATSNLFLGAGRILAFCWRYKWALLVLAFFLFGFGLLRGCSPFEFGKSRGELRLEREIAEANTRVAEFETRLAAVSRDLAVNSERDRTRRATVIAQAEQEIDDAAAQVDPDALYDAYAHGYLCVFDASACQDRANPAPSRAPAVRGAGADPA